MNMPMELSTSDNIASGKGMCCTMSSMYVYLHPLVIMNISEHFTRMNAQKSEMRPAQVFGALLGKLHGRHVEMINSFELKWREEVKGSVIIDNEFMLLREQQYETVFPELDFIGWYTVGSETPGSTDCEVHRQICMLHDSPLLLKLDPTVSTSGSKLPISIFESGIRGVLDVGTWHRVNFTLASENAERIGIEHVAQISSLSNASKPSFNIQISGQLGAIGMLQSRLELILKYIKAVRDGSLPFDQAIIREIAELMQRLPVLNTEQFKEQFTNQCMEVKITSLVAMLTKICGVAYEKMAATSNNNSLRTM